MDHFFLKNPLRSFWPASIRNYFFFDCDFLGLAFLTITC